MNQSEVASIINLLATLDQRIDPLPMGLPGAAPTDPRVNAWHFILADEDGKTALNAVKEIYSEPQLVPLQPGHIVAKCKQIRARSNNVSAVQETDLMPPDELVDESPDARRLWRKYAIQGMTRGLSPADARRLALQRVVQDQGLVLTPGPVAAPHVIEEAKKSLQRGFNATKTPQMNTGTKTG